MPVEVTAVKNTPSNLASVNTAAAYRCSSSSAATPAPATPAPGTPAPGTPAPGTPAPGTPAPGTPAPGTSCRFQHRTICARIHVWPLHFDTVAAGVEDKALGGPETHWLTSDQASQEGCRVVELQPSRG